MMELDSSLAGPPPLSQSTPSTSPPPETLTENSFLSICFSHNVSARQRLLSNGVKLGIRPNLLLTVYLGFTKDPYPNVRQVALEGLVGLSKLIVVEDKGLVEACFGRAVDLLNDMEDSVRSAAVRAFNEIQQDQRIAVRRVCVIKTPILSCFMRCAIVTEIQKDPRKAVRGVIQWGKILVALNPDDIKEDISDALFIQLCSMVRDMSVKVRVEAFNALGMLSLVSEEILLQTLSKKVLPVMREKTYDVCSAKPVKILASSAAGAFVHGLEDEFYEVRRSTCHSLQTLSILSMEFADKALNLFIEVLNDDSMVVRLQALETMHCMALYKQLKLQETHKHMFLSTLVDSNASVRTAARKVLRVAKLNQMAIFRLCTDGLLENLEMHPQDEADVLSVLFQMGRSHGTFAVKVIEGVLDKIEPSTNGKLEFDSTRIATLLVLAISVPLSNQQHKCSIPPSIFSNAVTILGRISHALSDVVDQATLLSYLSHCSRFDVVSAADFQFTKKSSFLLVGGDTPDTARTNIDRELLEDFDEVRNCVELIFEKMKDNWKLVQLGFIGEVQKTLSCWKEELATFTSDTFSDAIAFSYMYLKVLKVLAMMWPHFLSRRRVCSYRNVNLQFLLEKLDKILGEMQYRFIGLSEQEELHLLELVLLNFVLRVSTIEAFCESTTVKKLHNTLSRVEFLSKEQSIELSNFVTGLKKSLGEIDFGIEPPFYNPFLFQRLLESFSLNVIVSGKFKYIKAELEVKKNDFENPFRFIAGLPIGIPLDITLYNISRECRLWLKIVVDEALIEFAFLDLDRFGGSNKIRKFRFVAPFYKTPKAISFTIKIYLGMECLSEDTHPHKRRGGPKKELIYLCQEKEVFLSVE